MVGYSFWGFLGDEKFDKNVNKISTPDGNAFYSWSIISELQRRGKKVVLMMPDRDEIGYELKGYKLFESFAKSNRTEAYYSLRTLNDKNWKYAIKLLDYVIIEWRWEIKGRNDNKTKENDFENWQPDFELMQKLIKFCNDNEIPFVVFDLDYKLTIEDIEKYNIKYIIELGNKWSKYNKVKSMQVKIPFDFSCINEFSLEVEFDNSLVYIGNRYERDWCIDKYIPEDLDNCIIHGNWKESGRDSEQRWEKLKFGNRLQTCEMQKAYSKSLATILLAKEEYCKMHFMTARIIEAVFYGCVPFFIEEYGDETIMEYAGKYAGFLKVSSKDELKFKLEELKNDIDLRNEIIMYLRKHLRFMDCKFFIDDVEKLLGEIYD